MTKYNIVTTEGYSLLGTTNLVSKKQQQSTTTVDDMDCDMDDNILKTSRRTFGIHIFTMTVSSIPILPSFANTIGMEESNPESLLYINNVMEARKQLDIVPTYIDATQWDNVRAQLIRPPLSDCWVKTSRPWLSQYVEAIGTAGGDELAALEAKEDLQSHLRYLDMAVYNNNFNPIVSEGTNGVSPELIRSYYDDPIREWNASVKALDQLLELGGQQMLTNK